MACGEEELNSDRKFYYIEITEEDGLHGMYTGVYNPEKHELHSFGSDPASFEVTVLTEFEDSFLEGAKILGEIDYGMDAVLTFDGQEWSASVDMGDEEPMTMSIDFATLEITYTDEETGELEHDYFYASHGFEHSLY